MIDSLLTHAQLQNFVSLLATLATVSIAIITFFTFIALKRQMKYQFQPYVIVFTHHDTSRPTLIQIIIRNIGFRIAKNITFKFDRDIPESAFGINEAGAKIVKKMESGPLINGIPMLAPNEERIIYWGQYGGLIKNCGKSPIDITASFVDENGKKYEIKSLLEIQSFFNTAANNDNRYQKIVEELKAINTNLRQLIDKM